MSAIQKTSVYFIALFSILIVLAPLVCMLQWIFIDIKASDVSSAINFFGVLEREIKTPEGYVNLSQSAWTPLLQCLGWVADIVGILPFWVSLFLLKKLFSHYKKGEVFSVSNARIIRKLGIWYVMDALFIHTLSQTLLILVVTWTNPPGHRYLSISFGSPNLSSLFYGTLVIVISWVMLEAAKMFDENKFTV